jgi:diguanylate cyclase (GGDEF)-like protein
MSLVLLKVGAEKNIAQHEVEKGSLLLDSVFTTLPDVFFLVDEHQIIVDYRSDTGANVARSPDDFLGKPVREFLAPDIRERILEQIEKVRETGGIEIFDYDLAPPSETDEKRHFEARIAQVPKSRKVMIILRDVTEQWESEMLVEKQAFFDSLTALPNRYLALDRLNQFIFDARRYEHQIAVMILDLDDFKKINDTLGHTMGDHLLIEVARRLQSMVRKTDTVARLGGDEFIILVNCLNGATELHQVVEKIVRTVIKPFLIEGRELLVTCSLGIAIYPDDSTNTSDLLRKADMAMYHSKTLGKNQHSFFTEEMNHEIARRLLLETCMLNALENGEYEVHYQPQFELSELRLMGAEALLRWTNPELGAISPAEFIPIAEQNGQIIPIGYFVIEQSIAQCAQWRSKFNGEFRIAINLSPRQIRDSSILDFVKRQLDLHQLDGRYLEFEITEGVLLSAQKSVKDILNGFRELGVKLSMDDFGTGYSSLSYLQEYPFDMLKIDRSFIRNIVESNHSRSLVNAIIGLAHSLNLSVLAEGVETQSQADVLKEHNCDLIQGFLMGAAQQADTFYSQWSANLDQS